jgi:hypothetical protein
MPLDPERHEFMRYNNYGVIEYRIPLCRLIYAF